MTDDKLAQSPGYEADAGLAVKGEGEVVHHSLDVIDQDICKGTDDAEPPLGS